MSDVVHKAALNRYEMQTEHGTAIVEYRVQGDSRIFTHTEVPAADEGKGLGARIVKTALDDTRASGMKIVPACSFVVAYVRRHPEYSAMSD